MMLLLLFNVLMFISLLCHVIQICLLAYIGYRLVQDKNAAVTFVKSVWTQLQEDFVKQLFCEKISATINK